MADTMRSIRISKPQHVKRLLTETINALRHDRSIDTEKKARLIGTLSSVCLTSLRDGDIESRLSVLEKRMKA